MAHPQLQHAIWVIAGYVVWIIAAYLQDAWRTIHRRTPHAHEPKAGSTIGGSPS